ncbi:MAG: RNA polymerase sigma factor [Mangrovicoccus sp.]|nr:RNA polymerase sigma factor [Mangrovicoccus sp.]
MAHDRELLTRIGAGDREAMRQFYEEHHSGLTGFIRSRGADASAAADVVQDTMLEVWRNAERYRGDAAARTWLFSIARNKLIDRMRKNARLSPVEDVPEEIDQAPGPEATAIASAEAARVRACLDGLKPDHLSVIRLAFYEDMTYGEISRLEGIPAGTVKTRVFHAKQLLMRCLGIS